MGRKVMLETTCLITSWIPRWICFKSPGFVKLNNRIMTWLIITGELLIILIISMLKRSTFASRRHLSIRMLQHFCPHFKDPCWVWCKIAESIIFGRCIGLTIEKLRLACCYQEVEHGIRTLRKFNMRYWNSLWVADRFIASDVKSPPFHILFWLQILHD